MPEKTGPKRFEAGPAKPKYRKGGPSSCRDCKKGGGESDQHSLAFLPLNEAWVGDNNIERIRRKSVRPPVTTSFSVSSPPSKSTNQQPTNAISGISMVKLPHHTDKSMSHVAVAHFNMEKGSFDNFEEDSRVVGSKLDRRASNDVSCTGDSVGLVDLKTASHTAVFHLDPTKRTGTATPKKQSLADENSVRNHGKVFNTKYPRVDSSAEKYNPLPQRPYMVELLAPERYPADKLVQAIRVFGKEVEEMGGDTKMLHDTVDVDSVHPEHLKRNIRANLSPEASDVADVDGNTGKSVLIEVEKGVPMAIHARSTPYWAGHATVCDDPANCKHFLVLHPGFGFYGK